ncbi:DNA-(apurinic or apyrimidinic site) lyase [Apiospora rasikravindrae]|uniref:Endonuclease III homolog n=1 Tax=Apiospora rasikravindrae TaxID=990691 RepID=A0ABR1UE53_9PEZI
MTFENHVAIISRRYHIYRCHVTDSVSPPVRRITRGSLARFAYQSDATSSSKAKNATTPQVTDIEDAVSDDAATNTTTTTTLKRKRTVVPPSTTKRSSSRSVVVKKEEEGEETQVEEKKAAATPNRRDRKPARKTIDPDTNTTTVAPPSDWEEMYDLVKAMRLTGPARDAAVDTMGCERLALPTASPKDQRLHTLVALMLSSQTKDTTNAVAMRRLQTELPPHSPGAPVGLNLENLLAVDPAKLNELIWAVGFHNNKTKYIKQAAEILRDRWQGDIPDTIDGLTSLPGVGPKMAHLCLSSAWGRTEGIGVDVHVHRITNLWGWQKSKNPEETRLSLQSWLPRDRWREINWLLVGFGQKVCLPVGRRCGECELGLRGLCKAAERAKVIQGRKVREETAALKVERVKTEGGDDDELVIKEEYIKREEGEVGSVDMVINEPKEEDGSAGGISPKSSPPAKHRRTRRS